MNAVKVIIQSKKPVVFFNSFRYPVVVNLDELVVEIIKAQSFKGFLQMLG
jgi:hypothetical protein